VKAPVAVRYAWANNPAGANLWNQVAGKPFLPAGPFRTDDWPGKSTGVTKMQIDP
jgi:sialate O-acetylesterase